MMPSEEVVAVIVKHNLNPVKVAAYVGRPMAVVTTAAVGVVVARWATGSEHLVLPFAPVATLGAALSIFVGIRNNASYARWWEARTAWSGIQNNARVLARQLVAATDGALATGAGGTPDEVLAYRRELVLRLVAFAHALRLELRGHDDWDALRPYLPAAEHEALAGADNRTNLLLQTQAVRIRDGVRAGIVGQFDPITLEPNLAALNGWAAACERLRHTPTPRQYDYFTRVAVLAFGLLLPLALGSVVPPRQAWWAVVLSVVVAGVFVVLERVGAVLDAPFADAVTDVPVTAIATAIERDLLEQLGDPDRPAPPRPVDGYLW